MADISKEDLRKEIDGILEGADLDTLSSKKVRQQLEEKLKSDLSDRKKEIDELVMEAVEKKPRMDPEREKLKKQAEEEELEKTKEYLSKKKKPTKAEESEGEEEEEEEDEEGEEEEVAEEDEEYKPEEEEEAPKQKKARRQPPRKAGATERFDGDSEDSDSVKPAKQRKQDSGSEYEDFEDASSESSDVDSDEEYSPIKKGGANKKKPIKGGRGRKKKAGSSDPDDSDEDWKASNTKKKGTPAKKRERRSSGGKGRGYTRAVKLSPELSDIVGAESMPRHEVVKKMWSIIKERNLYDPKNKQFAVCDEQLQKVFGVKRFRTFGMMKYLKSHFVE